MDMQKVLEVKRRLDAMPVPNAKDMMYWCVFCETTNRCGGPICCDKMRDWIEYKSK